MSDFPKAIIRTLQSIKEPYALLLFLDHEPHIEFTASSAARHALALAKWRKDIAPTLKNSLVRYFIKGRISFTETKRP